MGIRGDVSPANDGEKTSDSFEPVDPARRQTGTQPSSISSRGKMAGVSPRVVFFITSRTNGERLLAASRAFSRVSLVSLGSRLYEGKPNWGMYVLCNPCGAKEDYVKWAG